MTDALILVAVLAVVAVVFRLYAGMRARVSGWQHLANTYPHRDETAVGTVTGSVRLRRSGYAARLAVGPECLGLSSSALMLGHSRVSVPWDDVGARSEAGQVVLTFGRAPRIPLTLGQDTAGEIDRMSGGRLGLIASAPAARA